MTNFANNNTDIIDVCYIDPPYNTGSKFLYHDNRKSASTGIFGSHKAWMSFMLPRLALARKILKQSGVIAISIDDYEFAYLKILMDSIFGENNFIGNIVVCRSKNGKGSNKNIASTHEYLMIYGKTQEAMLCGQLDDVGAYDKCDTHGEYKIDGLFRKKGEASLRKDRPNMYYPLFANSLTGDVYVEPGVGLQEVYPVDSKGTERRWLWSKETARERAWQLYASKKGVIYVKNYSSKEKRKKVRTLWDDSAFYTERATNEITKLFGDKIFDTPKPLNYIIAILDIMAKPDALIMDFFAGSATTAHAAAMLNNSDNGSRKTILMENNTPIPSSHVAHKHGYRAVSDITASRLKKISEEFPEFNYKEYGL
nr:site-specific DNA-methyltransferase [Serratia fonticola]